MDKIEMLFPTPVGIFDIGDKSFSTSVSNTPELSKNCNDVWKCNSDSMTSLAHQFISCANEVVKLCPAYSYHKTVDIKLHRGWIQTCGFGQYHHAHNHSSSLLVGVYYIQAEDGCGDLLLHDPAANSLWSNYYDNEQDCRVWNRIKPKTGRLVIFPGHIVHSTEPNTTNIPRIAIATNFKISFG